MKLKNRLLAAALTSAVVLFSVVACSQATGTMSTVSTMSVVVSTARASTLAEGVPELPRVYLNTTYTPPTGKTIAVPAGGNVQQAIEQAQPGDVITLQAGATYTGNFELRNKTGTGWITIRTSAPDSSLPPPGTRITPAFAGVMPKLISPNDQAVIEAENAAHHYRFIGVEFGVAPGKFIYSIIQFGSGEETTLSQLPHDLIIDRCYIHGNPQDVSRRGVQINCGAMAIIDSHISEIHETEADSQAIGGWAGPGPFKLVNNYFEGAGENVIFGGADAQIVGLVPSDIEFRRNYLSKPLSWKVNDPSYGGIHWRVKNIFELKNAQRVLIDQNVFENNWSDGQDGMAILFTVRNDGGESPWSTIQDVTFTNNIVRHSGGGIYVTGFDYIHPSQNASRILIKNNLLLDIDGVKWTGTNEAADGEFMQVGNGAEYITVDHNTSIQKGSIIAVGSNCPNFVFRNNISPHNEYGVIGFESAPGVDTLNKFFPDGVFQRNVLIAVADGAQYPTDNFEAAKVEDVKFVNAAADNYRLASGSPYRNKATDGLDIGCNLDLLTANSVATSVNASNYRENLLAPESIAAVFGTDLAGSTVLAGATPLPTSLGGTSIKVRDELGVERSAPLFFVSPTQVNFLVPPETAVGSAVISINNSQGAHAISLARIDRVAPGLFTADASGNGVPTGVALSVRNNTQAYSAIARFDQAQNKWSAIPIELGLTTDQVYLVLFGTGIRYRSSMSLVTATIGGVSAQVTYAAKQGNFDGLDQVNILIPRSLVGRGAADIVLTVDGQVLNTTQVNIK